MLWRKAESDEKPRSKLLLWVALAGVIFGAIGMGEPLEDMLRTARSKTHIHQASGDIVIVAVDDQSLNAIGRWPWRRSVQAELVDRLTAAGAKRIFFDVIFDNRGDPADDSELARAIARSDRVVLPVRTRSTGSGELEPTRPLEQFAKHSTLGSISFRYNYHNIVWSLPYADAYKSVSVPSFASRLASVEGPAGQSFPLDYSLDPASIPLIPAKDVIGGKVSAGSLKGKDVLIGATTDATGDVFYLPGWGLRGGAYVHAIGAETLKSGTPVNLGWVPAFLIAFGLAALASRQRRRGIQAGLLAGGALLLLAAPALLELRLVFAEVTAGIFVLLIVSVAMVSRHYRAHGLADPVSGLPNLAALRSQRGTSERALIVARVVNYAEVAASLPADGERLLIDQIVSRLRVGAPERALFRVDGGTFVWLDQPHQPIGNHLEALFALFRNPARVQGEQLDLAISFGIEVGSSRSIVNRLASATLAAEQAAQDGLKWKYHDPETLHDAKWKLSMMSQLDAAIDLGQVWVAFQPQLDLATSQLVGCEALARWTHPEKGPIAATEFIAAAEQHDRIGKLTDFVLERAIEAGAEFHRKRPGFNVSVNLSAKLLTDLGLKLRILAMLARHRFPAAQLTLELTETAELASNGSAIDMLASLREIGVTISIDDYGTGLSTLEYLKKVPATEIKIDQCFIRGLAESRSDRLMVSSTIALAHSLGRRVVAEGVQQRDTLQLLEEMKCDIAQGFIIGRPMSSDSLLKRIASSRRTRAA